MAYTRPGSDAYDGKSLETIVVLYSWMFPRYTARLSANLRHILSDTASALTQSLDLAI